ncbi:MAG TPA: YkgJ family cysteine cluster protein [Verrucomicrobiae bacterium]
MPPRKISSSAGDAADEVGVVVEPPTFDDSDASSLCVECGLCCDGSLFSEVELASDDEGAALESVGLQIEDSDDDEPAVLMQPCGALCGTRCSIYAQRPECCRTFECKVLRNLRGRANPPTAVSISGKAQRELRTTLDSARAKIRDLRQKVAAIEGVLDGLGCDGSLPIRERCFEAQEMLSDRNDYNSRAISVELSELVAEVQEIVSRDFLDC